MSEIDWNNIFESERRVMYSYAVKTVGDADTALDMIQEAFVRAFRFKDTFQEGTNFRAWLMTILKNTCMDHFRKVARRPQELLWDYNAGAESYATALETAVYLKIENQVATGSTEQEYCDSEISPDLMTALREMNPKFREVVLLEYFGGLTPNEIAEHLDIPRGTANTRKFRGLKQLREAMAT